MIRSRLHLPKLQDPPATVLQHLVRQFPHITEELWRDRMARGLVTTADGLTLNEHSEYRHGTMVLYSREVFGEPAPEQLETILFQDEAIVVADKPHGMTVTPAGDHVSRSLLHRLQERTAIEAIAPIHRLDKDTAGIVMFSINPEFRGAYHGLFANNSVEREYLAVAVVSELPSPTHWRVENRLERGEPWLRQRIVDGPINAVTLIDLLEHSDGLGLFRLRPQTGKKHQLRIHMASIGFPILGDRLYPHIRKDGGEDPGHLPLQLLARRLSFVDPCTRLPRHFESQNRLEAMRNFRSEEAFAYRSEA